ncbi:MAG TPA: hypothetical protein VH500_14170 [Nitrososphaeraceae archaeon]|jgi:hypothetical protein
MSESNAYPYFNPRKSVPLKSELSVLDREVEHVPTAGWRVTRKKIEDAAVEKYRSCGKGITFEDLQTKFTVRKNQAQRSLKHFHYNRVLFTAGDFNSQGIFLIENTNPQQYFPSCIKADILEDLKKRSRNVRVEPTVCNLSNTSPCTYSLSNSLEQQKAQGFMDVLIQLPFEPLHVHKLQLMLSMKKEYYKTLEKKPERINLAKRYEEIIGRRHVTYTFSPNGRVQIAIRSSDTPFRIETDEDEAKLFSFFGQVRDRLLHYVSDIHERGVPEITEWILKACDLNKDIEINDKAQLSLPDIQLKYADQVFRMYIKSLHDRAVCRIERSLTLGSPLVPVLEGIMQPTRAINDLKREVIQLKQSIDSKLKE